MMKRGMLLFAHGARDPNWAVPFEEVAMLVRQRLPTAMVKLAYLEFMTPSFPDAGRALVEAGCEHIEVVPLFLGAGGHVRKDLPALLADLSKDFPNVRWNLRPAIGEVASVIEAMAAAAVQGMQADASEARS
jgi:sirohydrochlorin cobaltochelatase